MMRQASGRNQRNRRLLIVKNVLQVCILVVVCLWLLYQAKLSYDKKKELRDNNSRILNNVARKDLTNNKVPESAGDKTPSDLGENEEVEEEREDLEVRRAMEDAEVTADDVFNEQDHEREDEDEQDSMSEDDKDDDQVEEAENIVEDHEYEEGSSQERHEKVYMGDDASSAVLQVNQRTGADDKNSSVREKDMQTNDTIDRKVDSKYSKHDAPAASVIAVENENNQRKSPTLSGATVEEIREGHSPVDKTPKQQVNSTIASTYYDSVKMQTDPLILVPSNETAGNETLIMKSVEDPNSSKSMVDEQLVRRNTTSEQNLLEEELL